MALLEATYPPFVAFGTRTLRSGAVGTDVAVLQIVYDEMLKVMNPPQGPMGQPIPVTGRYDVATVGAVKNIQSYFGLATDGVTGPNTYFVFGQGVGPHLTYGGPAYGSRPLHAGLSGGDVVVLQNRLNCFRYAAQVGGPADGAFGPKTAAAVTQFQGDAVTNGDTGVPSSGALDQATFDATLVYTYAGGRDLESGRNGFDVAFVQQVLRDLGEYAGPVHGYYDAATRAAVVAFQRSQSIEADGVVGPVTFYHLGLSNAVSAPGPLPVPPV